MPLLEFLKASPESVGKMSLQQVINLAGEGNLTDNSLCSQEFRDYLKVCELSRLQEFIDACLAPGSKMGLALQDIANELGRRLGFRVSPGRYRGVSGENGLDGLWELGSGESILVEVKTTDAYRINLETIIRYRDQLVEAGGITKRATILIIVGRQDTGDLEAQVRGSRHAWDIRIISVEALQRLCFVRLKTDADTQKQIEQLLIPFEYTRLDKIIDITFAAVADIEESVVEQDVQLIDPQNDATPSGAQEKTPSEIIEQVRQSALSAVSAALGVRLQRESRAMYKSVDGSVRIACSVSKVFDNGGLWYAFHPAWNEFLKDGTSGYFVLGVVSRPLAFLIPRELLVSELGNLWTTTKKDGKMYWHIVIRPRDNGWELVRRDLKPLDLSDKVVVSAVGLTSA